MNKSMFFYKASYIKKPETQNSTNETPSHPKVTVQEKALFGFTNVVMESDINCF